MELLTVIAGISGMRSYTGAALIGRNVDGSIFRPIPTFTSFFILWSVVWNVVAVIVVFIIKLFRSLLAAVT